METTIFTEYPDVVGVKELTKMLGIGMNKAYEILQSNQIKNFMIGNKYRIPKTSVIDFVSRDTRTE